MIKLLFSLFSFLSLTFAYDESLIKHSVNLSQAAYCVSSVNDWNCITCDPSVKLEYVVENGGSRAIQGFDPNTNTIFTSFRGSSNIQNWINNIKIQKISPYNDSSIEIEKGFYREYTSIQSPLFEHLDILKKKYNTNQLFITGHSAGAAMGTLMVYDILTSFPEYNIKHFINFGSPRVGNQPFVYHFSSYNLMSYRVTHYYDIVPHVPEEMLDFSHIPNEIWYNEQNNEYKICNDQNGEDDSCSNSCSPLHCTSTSDHLNYLNVSMGNDGSSCFS